MVPIEVEHINVNLFTTQINQIGVKDRVDRFKKGILEMSTFSMTFIVKYQKAGLQTYKQ